MEKMEEINDFDKLKSLQKLLKNYSIRKQLCK
jgi:hypothetical protein